MGRIYKEVKVYFPEGHVYIHWDDGDEDAGWEIEVTGENGIDGDLVTMGGWSFGQDYWSEDIWMKWGNYIAEKIKALEGKEDATKEIYSILDLHECRYDLTDDNHLQDLDKIIELVK